MVEQAVIDDMADYIVKLTNALNKKEYSPALLTLIIGMFVFHQFNGTRNDIKYAFDKIIKNLEENK